MTKKLITLLFLSLALTGCQLEFSLSGPDNSAFHAGRQHYIDGNFALATEELHRFSGASPDTKLLGRAWLLLGKTAIATADWPAARQAFEQVLQISPGSLEAQKARFKLAEVEEFTGRIDQAMSAYQTIAQSKNVMRAEAGARLHLLRKQ